MASAGFTSSAGTKRSRGNHEDPDISLEPSGKKVRPTLNEDGTVHPWYDDVSAADTPIAAAQIYQPPKYDSDDQSSMISEPGSPQDIAMSSDEDDYMAYSQSPEDHFSPRSSSASMPNTNNTNSPWRQQQQPQQPRQNHRIPTPFARTTRSSPTTTQVKRGVKQHIRQRHSQENHSDHLDVPSPIDEDEVPTPPSAAEAAGSQLSMLTVSDLAMEGADDDVDDGRLPAITVNPSARGVAFGDDDAEPAPRRQMTPDFEPMDSGPELVSVRKQRQRSGAQSNGSVSPAGLNGFAGDGGGGGGGRRGFSMGFRADCDKCRARVPGHMNHFVL